MNELTHSGFGDGSPATMGSREIAELSDKEHKHVIRDIRVMLDALGDGPDLGHVEEVKDSRGYTSEFRLPKDLTLTLISGYNVQLRHRIVKRLEEVETKVRRFEIPQSLPDALRLAADNAERANRAEAALNEATPKVIAFERLASSEGSFCLTDAGKLLQMRRIDLERELHSRDWIYRRPTSGKWLGKAAKEQQGLVTHKMTSGFKPDGTEWSDKQVRITPKGLAKLAILLGVRLDDAA